jgi:hypothetical protein
MNIICSKPFSIDVTAVPCTPDIGPAVPATWSDPQPGALIVTGFDVSVFQVVPACPAGSATANWDGRFPVRATTAANNLIYSTPGSTFFVFAPFFVQGQSCLISIQLIASTSWNLTIRCESSLQVLWAGTKTVGLNPIGTYMRVANAGSADLPLCLHVNENPFDWSGMVWVPTLIQPDGTASASGAGANFAVSATANNPVSNSGTITGSMNYTGPVCGARVRITVTGADTGGFSSFRVQCNGITIAVDPAVGFAVGVTDHFFTIQNPASPGLPVVAMPIQVRAIAQTNVVGNSPAYSGVLT